MFWGLILDSRKRYSQRARESYHLTMATLEPVKKEMESGDKYVSLKLEQKNAEYLLCTLQYGKVMQVPLDIVISKGEHTCFSLSGEGTVHLSGYCIEDEDEEFADTAMSHSEISTEFSELESEIKNQKRSKTNKRCMDEDSESEGEESEDDSGSILLDDDDDDDDDDDMEDAPVEKKTSSKSNKNNVQEISSNKSSNIEDVKKRKGMQKGNAQKKLKGSNDASANSSPSKTLDSAAGKKQQMQSNSVNNASEGKDSDQDNEGESEDDEYDDDNEEEEEEESLDDSEDDSTDDLANSSIGRTPMPNKDKRGKAVDDDLNTSDIKSLSKKKLVKKSKNDETTEATKESSLNIPSNNKGISSSTPKNIMLTKKNVGGVQIEDLRMGSGPPAKNGRFVSIHYIGKLTNGKTFDSNEPPKKPFTFRLGKGEVIKGFDMGILGMKVGGKRKITIPPNLAYGNQKNAAIPSNSTLVFILDLKAVN